MGLNETPLENVLSRLDNYKQGSKGYLALCPAHDDTKESLSVSEGQDGRALLKCFAGCPTENIVRALGLEMKDLFAEDRGEELRSARPQRTPRFTRNLAGRSGNRKIALGDLAADKGLDQAWLESLGVQNLTGGGVAIPYHDSDGRVAATRKRTALKAKNGSFWTPGTRLLPYGLNRLRETQEQGFLVLVEGESDAWTLWKHGFPCLGVPGATNAGTLERSHLEGVKRLYIFQEPDSGGEAFVGGVKERVQAIGFAGQVLVMRLDGTKDPNDLHKQDPAGFPVTFQAALDRATPCGDSCREEDDPYAQWHSDRGPYLVENATTYRIHRDRSGDCQVPLANFAARVVEQMTLDDGVMEQRFLTVEGRMDTGRVLGRQRVPIAKFQMMNWPQEVWGFGPSLRAGQGAKDHMRAAIEDFSGSQAPERRVYTYLGWRETERGWGYLHAGGAVGLDRVEVDLETDLQKYLLPDSGAGVDALRQKGLRASLSFLDLGDPRVTFPLWAAVYRAPLCQALPVNFMLWCLGESGAFKTTVSALALNHYGSLFDKDTLPGSWLDTENRLEQRAFLAKDALLVVDDFCPEKHAGLAAELDRKATRLVRAVGNNQGRGRMTAEATARTTYYPRGVVVSTAEQMPSLAPSALARLLPVPFQKGGIDPARLTALQGEASLLPHALAGYLSHLRPRIGTLRDPLRERVVELRGTALQAEGHSRLPEVVAHLFLGLERGLRYCVEAGALSASREVELLDQGWRVFMGLAREHGRTLVEERPTAVFLNAIQEGLAAGKAWLADRRKGRIRAGENGPGSEKLGWVDDEGIYLLSDSAYRFASDRLRHRGGVVLRERALKEMLLKDGLLLRGGEGGRLEIKTRCEGVNQRVMWLRPDALGDLRPEPVLESDPQPDLFGE